MTDRRPQLRSKCSPGPNCLFCKYLKVEELSLKEFSVWISPQTAEHRNSTFGKTLCVLGCATNCQKVKRNREQFLSHKQLRLFHFLEYQLLKSVPLLSTHSSQTPSCLPQCPPPASGGSCLQQQSSVPSQNPPKRGLKERGFLYQKSD